ELPENLTRLRCHYNQINCLPSLPQSLVNNSDDYFNISNNLFTCLPNYVPAMSGTFNSGWLSYPLCFPNDVDNSYGCTTFSGIAGNVFIDGNENCEKDSSETGVTNATIKLYNENNELIATTFTYGSVDNAVYYFDVDTGNYSVSLMTDDMPFQYTCTEPGATQEVVLSEAEPSAINVNFGIECPPGFDIGVQAITPSSFPFPGQQHTLSIFAGDYISWYGLQCTNGISGSVTVNISGPVNYVEPAENALEPNVSGNIQLTYDIADFGNVDFESSFGVVLETDTTALAGDLV